MIVLNGRDLGVLVKQERRNGTKRRPGNTRPDAGSNTKRGQAWKREVWA